MIPTYCPICGPKAASKQLYPQNFTIRDLNPAVFSARRLPDKLHYRLVSCQSCGLLRSDPVMSTKSLNMLYANSTFTYQQETTQLTRTYLRYIKKVCNEHRLSLKNLSVLEIGCGNGFLLEALIQYGTKVTGVEPSSHAVAKASKKIRPHIITSHLKKED